jgi:hypothetical protein
MIAGLFTIWLLLVAVGLVLKFIGWLGDSLGKTVEYYLTDDDDK